MIKDMGDYSRSTGELCALCLKTFLRITQAPKVGTPVSQSFGYDKRFVCIKGDLHHTPELCESYIYNMCMLKGFNKRSIACRDYSVHVSNEQKLFIQMITL